MSPDLDALLCHRYPRIFARRRESAAVTAMGRGFACDDGWFDLIDELCSKLQAAADSRRIPQRVAEQVKGKFGELRSYVWPKSPEARMLVDEARERSGVICEVCGGPGVSAPGCRHQDALRSPCAAEQHDGFAQNIFTMRAEQ